MPWLRLAPPPGARHVADKKLIHRLAVRAGQGKDQPVPRDHRHLRRGRMPCEQRHRAFGDGAVPGGEKQGDIFVCRDFPDTASGHVKAGPFRNGDTIVPVHKVPATVANIQKHRIGDFGSQVQQVEIGTLRDPGPVFCRMPGAVQGAKMVVRQVFRRRIPNQSGRLVKPLLQHGRDCRAVAVLDEGTDLFYCSAILRRHRPLKVSGSQVAICGNTTISATATIITRNSGNAARAM